MDPNTIFAVSIGMNMFYTMIILVFMMLGREAIPFAKARIFRRPVLLEIRNDNEVVPIVTEYKAGVIKSHDKTWLADSPYTMAGLKVFFAHFYGQTLNTRHVSFASRLREKGYSNPKEWLSKVLKKDLTIKTVEIDQDKLDKNPDKVEFKEVDQIISSVGGIEGVAREKAVEIGGGEQFLTMESLEQDFRGELEDVLGSNGDGSNTETSDLIVSRLRKHVSPLFTGEKRTEYDVVVPMNRTLRFPDIVNFLFTNTQPTLLKDIEVNAAQEERLAKGDHDPYKAALAIVMVLMGGAVAYLLISHGAVDSAVSTAQSAAGQGVAGSFLPVGGGG